MTTSKKTPEKQVAAEQPEADDYDGRIAELRERRKMRGTKDQAGRHLSVDKSKLDPRYKYRFINDENVSIRNGEAVYKGDWEFVGNRNGSLNDGRNVEQTGKLARVVDKSTGKRGYLMRKPEELWRDDENLRLEKLRSQEEQMRRDGVARGSQSLLDQEASHAYAPRETSRGYKP